MLRYIVCALLMISFVSNAQLRKLPPEFSNWLNSDGMRHATVSMKIDRLNGTDHQTVYEYDSERSVQPASVMKLVTTSAALSLLNPEKKIPTEVYIDGEVADGILNGNVVIRGYGNAVLSSSRSLFPKNAFANAVLLALKHEGIREIGGDIIGDGTILKESPVSSEWTWEDLGNHYAPSLSGLNYGDNLFEIVLNTSRRGHKPQVIKIEPEVEDVSIDNQLMSDDYSFDSAYVYGAPYQNVRTIFGAVPHKLPQFKIKGDVPDPAQFTASRIKAAIVESGIKVRGRALSLPHDKTLDYSALNLIYTHNSESLAFIAQQTNVFSVNMFAEMLLRQISLEYGDGSETSGINKIMNYLREENYDLDGIRMFDGCGLAPADRLTTAFIVELLSKNYNDKNFVNSLPVAGKTGTIYSFLKKTKFDGKARLKTGTTKSVIAYSGYVEGTDGNTYVVSIIVNNHTCMSTVVRKNIEKMLLLLIP